MRDTFNKAYESFIWAGNQLESRSGVGSTLYATNGIRRHLTRFLSENNFRHILDIPCGDWNWQRYIKWPCVYTGADIVANAIRYNALRFTEDNIKFIELDLTSPDFVTTVNNLTPKVDVIFCRDCLVHLDFEACQLALENIKKLSPITFISTTFPNLNINKDTTTPNHRNVNLEIAPFNLGKPSQVLYEGGYEHEDKSLGVWVI